MNHNYQFHDLSQCLFTIKTIKNEDLPSHALSKADALCSLIQNSLPKDNVISLVVSSVRTLSEVDVHFIRFETAKSLSLRKGCSTEFA